MLRQTPEPLVGAALRKNAEISLRDFQRSLRNAELLCKRKDFLGWSWLRQKPAQLVFHLHGLCLHLPCAVQDVVNGRVAEALPLKAMLRMKFKCNGCALRGKAVLVLRDNAERIAAFQPPDDKTLLAEARKSIEPRPR